MSDHETFQLGSIVLQCGVTLPTAHLAYKTFGTLAPDRSNVILYPTSYGAHHTDIDWLIGPERVLDPTRYFIVIPNQLGNGLRPRRAICWSRLASGAIPCSPTGTMCIRKSSCCESASASLVSGSSTAGRWADSRRFIGAPSFRIVCKACAPCAPRRKRAHTTRSSSKAYVQRSPPMTPIETAVSPSGRSARSGHSAVFTRAGP